MSDKFMFYDNFLYAIEQLPEEEQGQACLELCKFGITGELPKNKYLAMFCLGVQASVQKYQGRGGNHNPTGQNQYSLGQKEVKTGQRGQSGQSGQNGQNGQNTQTETETETETETKKDNLKVIQKKQNFIKPSLEDVRGYCLERNNQVDPDRWFDYYTSNGWKIGKNSMKDWRAAVRTWEKSSFASSGSKTQSDEEFYRKLEEL